MPTVTKAVANNLPQTIVVVDKKVLVRIEGLEKRAKAFRGKITPENLQQADAVLKEITALKKQIESDRKRAKEPVLDLGRAIDSAAKSTLLPLDTARKPLMGEMNEVVKFLERKRQEAEAAARREAARIEQERQEAERKRQAAIRAQEEREAAILANARAERDREEQEKARQAALKAQAEREATLAANAQAEEDEQQAVPEAVVVPDVVTAPVQVEVPEEVVVPEPVPEPAPVVVQMPAAAPKTSISKSKVKELVIEDASKIPYRAMPGGEPLLKPLDAAIKRALRAGITVPGCRLDDKESLASR